MWKFKPLKERNSFKEKNCVWRASILYTKLNTFVKEWKYNEILGSWGEEKRLDWLLTKWKGKEKASLTAPGSPRRGTWLQQDSHVGSRASAQSHPASCEPVDHSPPGSSVMGFYRQEHWSGVPGLLPGIFPMQGSNLCLLHQQWDSLPGHQLGIDPLLHHWSQHALPLARSLPCPHLHVPLSTPGMFPPTLLSDAEPLGKRTFRKAFPATLQGGWSPWALSHPAPTV